MKALFASVILFTSSFSFAQSMPLEDAITTFMMTCSIEKFCPAGSQTSFDMNLTANKAAASADLGGLQCNMLDMILDMPETKDALKIVAVNMPLLDPTMSSCLANM